MHTVTIHAAQSATEPLASTAVDRSHVVDEPSHIHLPRPGRGTRPATPATPLKEIRR